MTISAYLASRGVPQRTIDELLPHIPGRMQDLPSDDFCDAVAIIDPDRWFYWPGQTRFVMVGQCPNGDGVAIDTEKQPGAIFYVAHDLLGGDRSVDEMVIWVADSPFAYVRMRGKDDFPWDFWEAKARNTEPNAPPNGGPAQPLDDSGVTDGPPSVS
jgi:hypothetical protein